MASTRHLGKLSNTLVSLMAAEVFTQMSHSGMIPRHHHLQVSKVDRQGTLPVRGPSACPLDWFPSRVATGIHARFGNRFLVYGVLTSISRLTPSCLGRLACITVPGCQPFVS